MSLSETYLKRRVEQSLAAARAAGHPAARRSHLTLAAIYAVLVDDAEIDRQASLRKQRFGVARPLQLVGSVATPAE